MNQETFIYLILTLFLTSAIWFFIYVRLREKAISLSAENQTLKEKLVDLESHYQEKLELIQKRDDAFTQQMKSLSSDVLQKNSEQFLHLAKQSFQNLQQGAEGAFDKKHQAMADALKPVKESLSKMDMHLKSVEKDRTGAYEGLKQQVTSLIETQKELRSETGQLVKALRTPSARGRWGEMQLKRVVEMAGMLSHCDFSEQTSTESEEGRLRPDMIVRLPGEKVIVVDAKTPLAAYLDSLETDDEAIRKKALERHTRHIREHMKQLGSKSYWSQFEESPEFVVMFLPGENFFSAALEVDPALIEIGTENGVILATPTTLIALLRAVAYGWRQESLADNARQISNLGQDLYKRLGDMNGHLDNLGAHIGRSVDAYNKTIGTFESRVLVSARKFEEMKVSDDKKKITKSSDIEKLPRKVAG
jgi:DNA recombination protein RmuC